MVVPLILRAGAQGRCWCWDIVLVVVGVDVLVDHTAMLVDVHMRAVPVA